MRPAARLAGEARDPRQPLMYRLVYRNFGDHESLVVNHTVGTETGSAALRWYELRRPGRRAGRLSAGHLRSGLRTSAGWARSRWTATATSPSATRKSSAAMFPSIAATRGGSRATRSERWAPKTILIAGSGSQIAARAGGATTARCRSIPSTTARSGTRRSTTRIRRASTSRRGSAPCVSRAAPPALRALWKGR